MTAGRAGLAKESVTCSRPKDDRRRYINMYAHVWNAPIMLILIVGRFETQRRAMPLQLWLDPAASERHVYAAFADRVERWPWADPIVACGLAQRAAAWRAP